jgi:hypothetical protein
MPHPVYNTNSTFSSTMNTPTSTTKSHATPYAASQPKKYPLTSLPQALLTAGILSVLGLIPMLYATSAQAQNLITAPSASTPTAQAIDVHANGVDKAVLPTLLNEGVAFRRLDGVPLSRANSSLVSASEEALWRASKNLPEGSKILLTLGAASAVADGKSAIKVHIEVFDAQGAKLSALNGAPVKLLLETTLGRFQLPGVANDSNSTIGQTMTELAGAEVLLSHGEASVYLLAPVTPGDAKVRVSSGAVGVQGALSFTPDLRPMLLVGIVEGSIQLSKAKKSDINGPEIVNTQFEESLRNWSKTNSAGDHTLAGRVAFFAKGTIKGEYLLTAAADSDKITQEKLFRDIDPNAFYPIYGDSSVKQFDAQSKSQVYVRVDKDKSYLLYGDYSTSSLDEANKLASYNRSLTGAKWHYENQSVKVSVYGARDTLRSYVDEQAGRGISGPYAVGKPNAVVNSEQIELLVRERNAPAIVLKRQPLTRFADYDFEPFSGRVLFRQPVPSVDENNNPVSIRIAYEVEEGGEKYWVSGIDAKAHLTDAIAVGASYAQDRNPVAPFRIQGLNTEVKLGERTYLVGEVARSNGNQYVNASISAPLGSVLNPAIEQSGNAARLELRHTDTDLSGRAYVAKSDAAFQNPSAGMAPGRQEAGATLQRRINDAISLTGELQQTKDASRTATDGAKRDAASLGVGVKLSERVKLDISVNNVKELQVAGSGGFLSTTQAQQSSLPGLGWGSNTSFGFNGTGLLASPANLAGLTPNAGAPALVSNSYTSVRTRLTGQVTDAATAYAEYERAENDRQRVALGGEYRFNDKNRVYARHEFANSLTGGYGLTQDGSKTTNTAIGVDTAYMQDGQIFSEYRIAGSQAGQDGATAVGVRNLWRIGEGFNLTTAFERQSVTPANAARQDASAVSVGAEYTANALYKAGGKLEYRTSSVQNAWLSTAAVDRKLSDNWAATARNLYMHQQARGEAIAQGNGVQTQDRFQLGLAYRDTQENHWHGLSRLEYKVEHSDAVSNPVSAHTWIASLHGNYKPNRPWTFAAQTAYKAVNERFASPTGQVNANGTSVAQLGDPSAWNGTLLSGRVIWDFAERFDASVYASWQAAQGVNQKGLGLELGYRVVDNLWLSLGYTAGHYSDVEAFGSNQSWSAWRLRMRFKFDEKSFFN